MNTQINQKNIGIGISKQDLDAVVDILTKTLSDEYLLYTKTRNYHWNAVGPNFNDYHKAL